MTSILASTINSNWAHLRLWVLLLHCRHILLELRWSLRFGFYKVDLCLPRVVVGKHNNISVAADGLNLHWPEHSRVNQLKKSSLCLILRTQWLERLSEHPAHDACLTGQCPWALSMQLDTYDCIRELFDSWQREVAEASMPQKDILLVSRRTNVGIGLGGLGKGARSGALSGAQWIIYCYRCFRD